MQEKIRDYGLRVLARREHSVFEFTAKLRKKFPDSTDELEAVLTEFQTKDWLSDERFTEAFIRHQILTTKAGPRRLTEKLKLKGVSEPLIRDQLRRHFTSSQQIELIRPLAERKHQQIVQSGKTNNDYETKQKVIQYFISKGYSYDIAEKGTELL